MAATLAQLRLNGYFRQDMQISKKHVLITGAGKRLGRAIAERLLPYGINLSAHCQTSRAETEQLIAIGKKHRSAVHVVQGDLAKVSQVRAFAAAAIAKFGPVEILINSASIFYPTPLEKVTEENWDDLMNVNLKGQFFLTQACAAALLEKKRPGVLINLVDVNAQKTLPNFTPYVCSNAGLWMMTRNLAKELAPLVRANSISPGPVLLPENYSEAQRQRSEDKTLLKRLGSAQDIAEAAVFLIENDYVTGQDLAVDGGRSLADGLSG